VKLFGLPYKDKLEFRQSVTRSVESETSPAL
jgi:hypothetical protein